MVHTMDKDLRNLPYCGILFPIPSELISGTWVIMPP